MLLNGLTIPVRDLFALQRNPALLIRAMVAVIVLVPCVVPVILMLVELPVEVATGFALLAASPGAPLITQRSKIAAGSTPLAADLQLKLVLTAVLITPLTLTIFKALFPMLPDLASSPSAVAREIASVSLLPVGIGLFTQRFLPGFDGACDEATRRMQLEPAVKRDKPQRIFVSLYARCPFTTQARDEALKVRILAQQLATGGDQLVHLLVGQGKAGRDLIEELQQLRLLDIPEADMYEVRTDVPASCR